MSNIERYSEWAGTAQVPLSMQPWWLDAVCAGRGWDVLLATDEEGRIIGAMPYMMGKRLGMRHIAMPEQTPVGGIWIDPSVTHDRRTIAQVCAQLAEQLGSLRLCHYKQRYAPRSLAAKAMQSLGFRLRERTTYRIDFVEDADTLTARWSADKRGQLERGQSLSIDPELDLEDFYRYYTQCMRERHKPIGFSREFLLVLASKLERIEQCRCIGVRTSEGALCAAAFVVWDAHTLYYLMPCYSPDYHESGAGARLVAECIRLAREIHRSFDFATPLHPRAAAHHSQYGATPVPYTEVERYYHPVFWLVIGIDYLRDRG